MYPTSKVVIALFTAILSLGAALPAAAQYYGRQGGYGMMSGGHWFFGGLMMVLFVAVVIALIVLLAYWLTGGSHGGRQDHQRSNGPTPMDILEERFARGEIDADEFEDRKKRVSK